MGFDSVDRRYRPKVVRLECEECGTIEHVGKFEDRALCRKCALQHQLEEFWASGGILDYPHR